jgi:uncharacterized phiE125 gp8 family phage protein
VTVAECKLEARVDGSDEDSLFAEWIAESRDEVEDACRRALITRTLEVTLRKFPRVRRISLPYPPLVEVNAITYYDQDNVQQTMAESDYIVVADDTPGYVHLAEGASWPTTNLHDDPRIRIEYEAGHGTTAANGDAVYRGAIRALVALRYDCRSAWTPDAERKRQRVLAWVERKYGW